MANDKYCSYFDEAKQIVVTANSERLPNGDSVRTTTFGRSDDAFVIAGDSITYDAQGQIKDKTKFMPGDAGKPGPIGEAHSTGLRDQFECSARLRQSSRFPSPAE